MLYFSIIHLRLTVKCSRERADRYMRSAILDGDVPEAEAWAQAILFNTHVVLTKEIV